MRGELFRLARNKTRMEVIREEATTVLPKNAQFGDADQPVRTRAVKRQIAILAAEGNAGLMMYTYS